MEDHHPLLDFAAVERGMSNEKLSTLGNLVCVTRASVIEANVLRYLYDAGAVQRPVPLETALMAGCPWIMASERSIRRAVAFWENEGIIEIDRDQRDTSGRKAPSIARLLWSSVLRRLIGEAGSVSTSPVAFGREPVPADYRGGSDPHDSQPVFYAPPTATLAAPAASLSKLAATVAAPAASLSKVADTVSNVADRLAATLDSVAASPPNSRSPIRVLACARGLLASSSVFSVDDVDSAEGGGRRIVEFSQVMGLVEEARRPLYRANWPRDTQVPQLFVAASVLGLSVLSREWIMAATRATASAPSAANHAWRYWIGCLRNGLVEIEGLPRFASREEAASYFAQLTRAVEPVTTAIMGEYADAFLPAKQIDRPQNAYAAAAESAAGWAKLGGFKAAMQGAIKGPR